MPEERFYIISPSTLRIISKFLTIIYNYIYRIKEKLTHQHRVKDSSTSRRRSETRKSLTTLLLVAISNFIFIESFQEIWTQVVTYFRLVQRQGNHFYTKRGIYWKYQYSSLDRKFTIHLLKLLFVFVSFLFTPLSHFL